jgi:hypothetical protein
LFAAPARSDVLTLPGDPNSTRTTASVGANVGPAEGAGTGAFAGGKFAGGGTAPALVRPGALPGGDGGGAEGRGFGTSTGGSRAPVGVPGGSDVLVSAWSPDGKVGGSGRTLGQARTVGSSPGGLDGEEGGRAGGSGSGGGGKVASGATPGADRLGPVQFFAGEHRGTGTDASGPTVLVPADPGAGLGRVPAGRAGNVDPRAQPLSEVVLASSDARFLNNRNVGGFRTAASVTPVETRGYGKRTDGTGGGGGARPKPAPQVDPKIGRALDFLQRQQMPDGSWSLHNIKQDRPDRNKPRIHSNVAATGLALLAFMGDRHHHLEPQGEYNATIETGLRYLVAHQSSTGEVFVSADENSNNTARTYSHAIATLALCEAFGMTGDPKLREPAQRAINFAVSIQNKQLGGWRYTPQVGSDTSITGWMFGAVDAGSRAQLNVPRAALEGVDRWLDFAGAPGSRGAQYVYNPQSVDALVPVKGKTYDRSAQRKASPVNTAVGLYVRLTRGWSPTDPRVQQGADYLMQHLPENKEKARNTYYWYYATQVMYHVQGPRWEKWHRRLSAELEKTQVQTGPLAGSWDPRGDVPDEWGAEAGRIFVTAMNLLSLEAASRVVDSPTPLKAP